MQQTEPLRIFSIISQIEQTLEASPKPKLGGGGNRRTVEIDLIYDLLGDLKVTIPEDIRRANSVLIEADTLLSHANEEADEIVTQAHQEAQGLHQQALQELQETRVAAQEEYEARVAEHPVLLEAQRRADLLQQHAEHNANVVYYGAKQYADEILQDVQRYLAQYSGMVEQNRAELGLREQPQNAAPTSTQPTAAQGQAPQSQAQQGQTQQWQAAPAAAAPAYSDPSQEEFEPERPRKRWSLFGRKNAQPDDMFDEDDELAAEPPAPRSRRREERDDLDIDLGE